MTITRQKRVRITRMKSWMVVSKTGEAHLEDIEKHSIMQRTGIPSRDLRVLDSTLSEPSSIIGREKAIVMNLENVKGIITAMEVLMINSSNPFFLRFLQDLQSRLMNHQTPPFPMSNSMSNDIMLGDEDSADYALQAISPSSGPKQLPFEFRVLETCIEYACSCLQSETSTLEEEAYPALDELTSQVSTLNLQRVRQMKSRLVALSGRVQKVADELEHLLDDDDDMAEMYLTRKLNDCSMDQSDESNSEKYVVKPDVEELEMLLEAYFVQLNGILQRLSSLSEYVDDTEDYIKIILDDTQNELLQSSIIINSINMVLNAGIAVVGLFGMNIKIELFDSPSFLQFWVTVSGTLGGCISIFFLLFWWAKKKNYLLSR